MRAAFLLLLAAALGTQKPAPTALLAQEPSSPATPVLDFEFFKTKVQPIFLAKREGHTRCVSCHSKGTPMRLQALSPGATAWNEEQSRTNFRVVLTKVVPYNLLQSRLLLRPLASEVRMRFGFLGWTYKVILSFAIFGIHRSGVPRRVLHIPSPLRLPGVAHIGRAPHT